MTRILLIPSGKTFWTEEGRLAGSADLPLSKQGYQDAQDTAGKVAEGQRPQIVYAGTAQASQETVKVISQVLEVKTKVLDGLQEPDMGLWEGLTASDLRQRNPKAYRLLAETPSKVNPPSGEPLGDALSRLIKVIDRVANKHKGQVVGLIVGPVAEFLLQSWLHGTLYEEHWSGRETPQIVLLSGGTSLMPDAEKPSAKGPEAETAKGPEGEPDSESEKARR